MCAYLGFVNATHKLPFSSYQSTKVGVSVLGEYVVFVFYSEDTDDRCLYSSGTFILDSGFTYQKAIFITFTTVRTQGLKSLVAVVQENE
jgi:hypothetical protein